MDPTTRHPGAASRAFRADVAADVAVRRDRFGIAPWRTVLINRGFHALLAYRVARWLRTHRVPLLPELVSRVVQILYGIDINPEAAIAGGVVITHGQGLVIGRGVVVGAGVNLYHGVTLGVLDNGRTHGYPTIGEDCLLGAGCKILGPVTVGARTIVGANVVLTTSVGDDSIVKVPSPIVRQRGVRAAGDDG